MEDEFREPSACELVQRHRITSFSGNGLIVSPKRPSLSVRKHFFNLQSAKKL